MSIKDNNNIKIAIIEFPGSNCERETMMAVKRAGMAPEEFLWNSNLNKLKNYDGYIIVGGFSYEDRGRAGVIAAHDPLLNYLKIEAENNKPILGICNGAQILVEAGLVPGFQDYSLQMALSYNQRIKNNVLVKSGYFNEQVILKRAENTIPNFFTDNISSHDRLELFVANGEGRFIIPEDLLNILKINNLIAFQYSENNPNNSIENIAGILNFSGNILALMPHPERNCSGDKIFLSLKNQIIKNKNIKNIINKKINNINNINYNNIKSYQKDNNNIEYFIRSMISDATAISIENSFRQLGFKLSIKRLTHWEIIINNQNNNISQKIINDIDNNLIKTELLYNPNREYLDDYQNINKNNGKINFLVRPMGNAEGYLKYKNYININNKNNNIIKNIIFGVIWQIIPDDPNNINNLDFLNNLIKTNLLFNPYSSDYFIYS